MVCNQMQNYDNYGNSFLIQLLLFSLTTDYTDSCPIVIQLGEIVRSLDISRIVKRQLSI